MNIVFWQPPLFCFCCYLFFQLYISLAGTLNTGGKGELVSSAHQSFSLESQSAAVTTTVFSPTCDYGLTSWLTAVM